MRNVCEQEMLTRKLTKNQEYLETLVPYLNNPSAEAIFGSNKIKEEHETTKLQNEEVMLKNFIKNLINEVDRPVHA